MIHFDGLRPGERKIVSAERNQEMVRSAFSSVAGQAVEVRLDVGGPESARGAGGARDQDSFTREVADLFGGSIEERG